MVRLGGVDLGASHLRAAVASEPNDPLAVEITATPADDGTSVARAVADALQTAAERAGSSPGALEAVGIGSIGPLDRAAGAVVDPANLPGVDRVPLRDALVPLVGHPRIYLVNDAVAGLIAERVAMPNPPANLVYLTLSTGIGAGVSVDGHVLEGREGNAAEVGHLVVDPAGRRTCGCDRPGHWEAYCGGAAIPDFARDLATEDGITTGLDLDDPQLSAADVFAAADGDRLADRVIERVAAYNAIGVADIVHAYAPECIALGGAVALENPSRLIDPLEDAVAEYAMLPVPEIRPATHGRESVLRGALALAAQEGLDD